MIFNLTAVCIGPSALPGKTAQTDQNNPTGHFGKVHTTFRRVINISWPDGTLSSISRRDVSSGPANIVTSLPATADFALYEIKPGSPVWLNSEHTLLSLGNLSVTLKNAPIWNSPIAGFATPACPAIPAGQVEANLQTLAKWLEPAQTQASGLTKLFPHLTALCLGKYRPSAAQADSVTALAGQAINSLLPSLRSLGNPLDKAGIEAAVSALIGLGPGLTPSGDDYLAGLLLSLTVAAKLTPETFRPAQQELAQVVKKLAPRLTHDLSGQMLALAASGTGSELMEIMALALFSPGLAQESLIQAAADLSEVGASSGLDQLLGLMSGAVLYSISS